MIEAIDTVAESRGKNVAQVALRWPVQKPGVTDSIVAARTLEQLTKNLGCLEWELSAGEMQAHAQPSSLELLSTPTVSSNGIPGGGNTLSEARADGPAASSRFRPNLPTLSAA